MFEDPLNEVYLLFYQAMLPVFTALSKFLQRETPCIHLISDKLEGFFCNILGKFLTIKAIKKAKQANKLFEIDFWNPEYHLAPREMGVGFFTRNKMQGILNGGVISEHRYKKFYQAAILFFTTTLQYALDIYPFKYELLQHCKCVNLEKHERVTFSSIEYFIH